MALADAFSGGRRFPGALSSGESRITPPMGTDVSASIGLPESRPGGRFKREHRITEGGTFDENPNVQAASIANLPGRGLSASAPSPIASAPSSLAGAGGVSPLAAPFQRQTKPVAPAAGMASGSGDIDELLKMIIG